MRQLVVALALAASTAGAEPSKHDKLDISDAAGKVDVLRDATGKYYVVPKAYGDNSDIAKQWTFYGDGRTMYQQRIVAFSTSNGEVMLSAWSPRTRNMHNARLEKKQDGTTSLSCRMKSSKFERTPLTVVSESEATKLLATATFLPPLWDRTVQFFGRGEGTTYFLVDVLLDGGGHRLWKGEKGRMKQIALADVADDKAGTVLVTKGGELSITKTAATWKQGKTTTAVSRLEPAANGYLIYRELGVYGQLGTFCEDQ